MWVKPDPISSSRVSFCGFSDPIAWEDSLVLTEQGKAGLGQPWTVLSDGQGPFSSVVTGMTLLSSLTLILSWGGNPGLCWQGLHATSPAGCTQPSLPAWPLWLTSLQSRLLELAVPSASS